MKNIINFNEYKLILEKWAGKPRPKSHLFKRNIVPDTLNYKIIEEMFKWKTFVKSPYGYSFYNKNKSWDKTIDGTIRVSDHWNWVSNGKLHAKTDIPVKNNTYWTIAKYNKNSDTYKVIESYKYVKDEDKIDNNNKIKDIKDNWIISNYGDIKNKGSEIKNKIRKGLLYAELKFDGKILKGKLNTLKRNKISIILDNGDRINRYYGDFNRTEIKITDKYGKIYNIPKSEIDTSSFYK